MEAPHYARHQRTHSLRARPAAATHVEIPKEMKSKRKGRFFRVLQRSAASIGRRCET
jgi:hypothetical protein